MIPPEIEAVALLGWAVYPSSSASKAGAFRGAHLAATCDLNTIARWSAEYRRCNWRVVFGPSRLWGLDVDAAGATHEADGIAALRSLVEQHGLLPPRPMTRSGGGGYALFFAHHGEKIAGKSGTPLPGIDPRRGMLSVTIPPSIHTVTGKPYRWLVKPWQVNPPRAPDWLLRLVEPPPEPAYVPVDTSDKARFRLNRALMAVLDADPGSRNETLNRRSYQVGRMVGRGLLAERDAFEALYSAGRTIGLEHVEIQATVKSGLASGRRNPGPSHAE